MTISTGFAQVLVAVRDAEYMMVRAIERCWEGLDEDERSVAEALRESAYITIRAIEHQCSLAPSRVEQRRVMPRRGIDNTGRNLVG